MYRKFIITFLFIFVFLFFIAYPVAFFMILSRPTNTEINLERLWQYKENIAHSISQPKIVFAAGSSVLHGIDTERISRELHIPTVNMGTYAATTTYFMDRIKLSLRSGDILVLPIEYSIYTHRYMSDMGTGFIISQHKDFFYDQSIAWQIGTVYNLGINNILHIAKMVFISDDIELNCPNDRMNTNGDVNIIRVKKKDVPIPVSAFDNMEIEPYNIHKLEELISYCSQNNIKVYATWPPFLCPNGEFDGNDRVQIESLKRFYSDHNVEIIGNYTDFLYKQEDMFDTKYHLNDIGRDKYTTKLIEYLHPIINNLSIL